MTLSFDDIGKELVACQLNCPDILLDQESGVLPRCLVLEEADRSDENGCVLVGLNPGASPAEEREFYSANGGSYASVKEWWSKSTGKGAGIAYYTKLRGFLEQLDFEGPILWTELVKCELAPGIKTIPLQTKRTCASHFLLREMVRVPERWPVFALGKEAFEAVSYLLPSRAIVGVPHPTGSFGQWPALFVDGQLRSEVRTLIRRAREKASSIWLSESEMTRVV